MTNESRDPVGKIPSPATELNDKNIYIFQIELNLCYKLGQLCLITNYPIGYRVNDATDWGSFILQIGVNVLQIKAAITN